ncbi:MAG: winged helix-turn-helix transcriptional regulator [Chlorobi bacterium]|nr:winged helix-turn-helix transcriptional regulator [Chlorobiota bacterium]
MEKNNPISCQRLMADEVQIHSCRETLKITKDDLSNLSKILNLAGNEVRLKIIYLIKIEGELCPCDLSDILDMTVPAISQHLRKLKDGNVLGIRKVGQTIFYSLNKEYVKYMNNIFAFVQKKETNPVE